VLRWRLLVATVIIIPLVGLLLADFHFNFGIPGIWLWPLPLLLTVMAVAEVLDLLRSKNLRPAAWSVYTGSLLIITAGIVPMLWNKAGSSEISDGSPEAFGWPLIALALGVALAFVAEMIRFREPGHAIVNVALAVFTIAFISLLMIFLFALRVHCDNRWGMAALVSLIFVTKMSDTGAYTCGRMFGRHKMVPLLSPKKTIEGGVGGVVTACLCSWLFFYWMVPMIVGPDAKAPTWWGCLVYGIVIAVAGIVGDLSESLLKRDMERKDSSTWIPGLGGVLDVLDSLLIAAPVAYLCWVLGIVGP